MGSTGSSHGEVQRSNSWDVVVGTNQPMEDPTNGGSAIDLATVLVGDFCCASILSNQLMLGRITNKTIVGKQWLMMGEPGGLRTFKNHQIYLVKVLLPSVGCTQAAHQVILAAAGGDPFRHLILDGAWAARLDSHPPWRSSNEKRSILGVNHERILMFFGG